MFKELTCDAWSQLTEVVLKVAVPMDPEEARPPPKVPGGCSVDLGAQFMSPSPRATPPKRATRPPASALQRGNARKPEFIIRNGLAQKVDKRGPSVDMNHKDDAAWAAARAKALASEAEEAAERAEKAAQRLKALRYLSQPSFSLFI